MLSEVMPATTTATPMMMEMQMEKPPAKTTSSDNSVNSLAGGKTNGSVQKPVFQVQEKPRNGLNPVHAFSTTVSTTTTTSSSSSSPSSPSPLSTPSSCLSGSGGSKGVKRRRDNSQSGSISEKNKRERSSSQTSAKAKSSNNSSDVAAVTALAAMACLPAVQKESGGGGSPAGLSSSSQESNRASTSQGTVVSTLPSLSITNPTSGMPSSTSMLRWEAQPEARMIYRKNMCPPPSVRLTQYADAQASYVVAISLVDGTTFDQVSPPHSATVVPILVQGVHNAPLGPFPISARSPFVVFDKLRVQFTNQQTHTDIFRLRCDLFEKGPVSSSAPNSPTHAEANEETDGGSSDPGKPLTADEAAAIKATTTKPLCSVLSAPFQLLQSSTDVVPPVTRSNSLPGSSLGGNPLRNSSPGLSRRSSSMSLRASGSSPVCLGHSVSSNSLLARQPNENERGSTSGLLALASSLSENTGESIRRSLSSNSLPPSSSLQYSPLVGACEEVLRRRLSAMASVLAASGLNGRITPSTSRKSVDDMERILLQANDAVLNGGFSSSSSNFTNGNSSQTLKGLANFLSQQ